MRTSNLSSKKCPHRTQNRTPKIYRWADIATEALIYFTILWGPWAFGTVHDWAILTMNFANYSIGALLLTKWAIRYKTGYYPPRWTTQKNDQSTTLPPKRDWRTKAVAALTIYMLGYILTSILNVRATFNYEFNYFEYQENYIKWLPHTYDKSATSQSFLNFLGLACCFWGIRDWLLGKTRKERMDIDQPGEELTWIFNKEHSTSSNPTRLNRLLWLLCISGGCLALIGIMQRLDGTPKLLWIYERERFGTPRQSFGPFGYRSNGASYINMILPICISLVMWKTKHGRTVNRLSRLNGNSPYLLLTPIVALMLAAPFYTLSRGGFAIFCLTMCTWLIVWAIKLKQIKYNQLNFLVTIPIIFIFIGYFVDFKPILNRLEAKNSWYQTQYTRPCDNDTIHVKAVLPPPPYDNDHLLFEICETQNVSTRKSIYKSVLFKNGNLGLSIVDRVTKGSINYVFTNLVSELNGGALELQISRNYSGVTALANSKTLRGIEETSGDSPTLWSHPIVPNEILLNQSETIPKDDNVQLKLIRFTYQIMNSDSYADSSKKDIFAVDHSAYFSINRLFSMLNSRERIYSNTWKMVNDYTWLGCGSAAWSPVYFLYRNTDEEWHAWAHCDWIEYWVSFGLIGMIPGLSLFVLTMIPIRSQAGILSSNWLITGLNLAIAGCLVHALFDFPLQVISIMHLFVILCVIKMVANRQS